MDSKYHGHANHAYTVQSRPISHCKSLKIAHMRRSLHCCEDSTLWSTWLMEPSCRGTSPSSRCWCSCTGLAAASTPPPAILATRAQSKACSGQIRSSTPRVSAVGLCSDVAAAGWDEALVLQPTVRPARRGNRARGASELLCCSRRCR